MQYIESHTHLDHYTEEELESVIAEIERHQITTYAASMSIASYDKTKEIAQRSAYIIPTFGIHPWCANKAPQCLEELDTYLEETPFIAEIGLDYCWVEDTSSEALNQQNKVFEYCLSFAHRHNKVVVMHTKGAEKEVLEALARFPVKNIIHWYSGPLALISDFIEAGTYFTISVDVLFQSEPQAVAEAIPLSRLLIETDNPSGYHWFSGEQGMPRHLMDVYQKVSEIKGVSLSELREQVQYNIKTLNLPTHTV
ncbi:TatD family hydrolase [Vibrio sp.]|nr:TatD family hydrolase [Vibrio sp.]